MSVVDYKSHELRAPRRQRLAILGATGSIGTQTLDVCRKHADRLEVVALSADSSVEKLVAAAQEFNVAHVALANPSCKSNPKLENLPKGCALTFGPEAVRALAELDEVDTVVVAVVGAAAIDATIAAIQAHKFVACANKEVLVMAGDLIMQMVEPGKFIPVDSEHSAIFQSLVGETNKSLRRIWLTCSGGPFFGKTRAELAKVTARDALAHPNWLMGDKITIDSATLMNKGLEVIEAHHLFDIDAHNIDVLIQRSSRVHSMVEFSDGLVKAQLGPADMRGPIQYALSYPDRWESCFEPDDYRVEAPLTFAAPDTQSFGCLRLAYEAASLGGVMPCALNAANEVANAAFRAGDCAFLDIEDTVANVLGKTQAEPVCSLEQLLAIDTQARAYAQEFIRGV